MQTEVHWFAVRFLHDRDEIHVIKSKGLLIKHVQSQQETHKDEELPWKAVTA